MKPLRRWLALSLVAGALVAACGAEATPSPAPTESPTPIPTDVFAETPEPTVEPEEPTAPAGTLYEVKPGDTMWAIARQYGISLEALKEANPDVVPTRMQVGTILIIPEE
jgi:2',3'-cyclic-nucleotide 2'-phosphodiesterase/3'-nucleotidase